MPSAALAQILLRLQGRRGNLSHKLCMYTRVEADADLSDRHRRAHAVHCDLDAIHGKRRHHALREEKG